MNMAISLQRTRRRSWLLVAFILVSFSCNPFFRSQASKECKEYLNLHPDQRLSQFQSYPIEKQVSVYLCMARREAPDLGLAESIAKQGESVIPYLVERLKSEPDEYDQRKIILIFEVLSENGHLRAKQDVLTCIREVVSSMKDAGHKEIAVERLQAIEQNVAQ